MSKVDRFELTIHGEPVPLERARRGAGGRWYLPPASSAYRELVQAAWLIAGRPCLGEAPIAVSAEFHLARPAARPSRRAAGAHGRETAAVSRADVDNLLKGLLDALHELAWHDDRQVVCLAEVWKRWAPAAPYAVVRAWRVADFDEEVRHASLDGPGDPAAGGHVAAAELAAKVRPGARNRVETPAV